ncbi:Elongator complex protein 6 [Hypsizygus marmoreus]|uniref:Elongator complex protein 6 n=1 Tax=Hypsizygus marmoreus TaxID=39966 RepID=A0A369K601_HYPMA|nr:Elongator complex protein 6 [Hypsizygus marmoreus]
MLSPFNLPEGILLLITDELSSPADFLLHRHLASHIKEAKDGKTVILSVSEDVGRWKAVAAKSNINVSQHLDSGGLIFLDVLSQVRSSLEAGQPSLRSLMDLVVPTLAPSDSPLLVILDDISSLEWIGFSLLDITRFSRALYAKCRKANATLLIRHHNVTPDEPDDLFRHLLQLCTYHMEVRSLASGRSGSVSGEIALHSGLSAIPRTVKLIPRSSAIQYRLTDNGAVFFGRGTGGGVL